MAGQDTDTQKQNEQAFFDLAERFREATEPDEVGRLGDELGRMIFAGDQRG